jgi:hypothetical protein
MTNTEFTFTFVCEYKGTDDELMGELKSIDLDDALIGTGRGEGHVSLRFTRSGFYYETEVWLVAREIAIHLPNVSVKTIYRGETRHENI